MKKQLLLIISALIILSFSIASCQGQDQFDLASIPSPEEGNANVFGKIQFLNQSDNEGIYVWITPIYRTSTGEGVYALNTSSNPHTQTDENGYFVFEDIDPGEYILFVGDLMTKFEFVPDDNGEIKVWDILPNEINDLGVISIEF